MAQGTPLIFPINIGWNANGTIANGAIATFYLAGTVTLVNIYADVSLTTPLANPLTADGSGRFPEIFVTPGVSYKIKLTDSTGVALDGYPADNIPAVPTSSSNQEVNGTAGETLTAGLAVYLSDGSGGKTAGSWYKADSANTYSSTTPEIGMVPVTITSGSTGSIRLGGSMTGLSVSIGQLYYVGTAGAITSTAPANARLIGQADTTTSIVLAGNPQKYGPGSPSTLTAHGVVVGNGASAVNVTAALTTGQLLVGVTGADPVAASAAASGASQVLLKANSGTDTSAAAANVDTIAITGLTAKDRLLVKINAISVTQQTAGFSLFNSTDSVTLFNMGVVAGGATAMYTHDLAQSQASATSINILGLGRDSAAGLVTGVTVAAVTQAWTGSWTLALHHTGVTAGGTLQWAWSVYKLAGQ